MLSIGAAVYFVSRTTTRQAEAELQRGLIEAGTLVDQQCATLVQTLTVMARLVADDPETESGRRHGRSADGSAARARLSGAARRRVAGADQPEAASCSPKRATWRLQPTAIGALPEIRQRARGARVERILAAGQRRRAGGDGPHHDRPATAPEIMGTLTFGFRLDNDLAAQFKRATESDIAFAVDGQIKASTLPPVRSRGISRRS